MRQFAFWVVTMNTNDPLPILDDLQEQLTLARKIQQSLLPQPEKTLPYVHACSQSLPCYEVSGDYLDYFDLDGERFCFALGDAAGKGISAALLASQVQGILSAQSFRDCPLSAIISNLNRTLTKRGIDNRFVTFFFGMLDPEGNCSYVNAGHDPPILMHLDGSMKELTEGGVVLGLFPEAQYESHTVRLHPGDHLILFTDGVVEAVNIAGEEFGKERLCALMHGKACATATELLSCLRDAVVSFAANTLQHDDITMMILGFRESETPLPASPGRFQNAGSLTPFLLPRIVGSCVS
jgi:sigma-B regulation protein RsbU (phosphoserine phosphatase)